MVFYKKVDAQQLLLSPEELEALKKREPVTFMAYPVKEYGNSYFAMLQSGENMIKVSEGQWVVKHPDGYFEVLWPDQMAANFVKAEGETIKLHNDPFLRKSFNQPTVKL